MLSEEETAAFLNIMVDPVGNRFRPHVNGQLAADLAAQAGIGMTSGLMPSLTLGCGTFGGTSTTDNVFSQNHPDTGTSPEGRSIGDVRDQSAPTVCPG